MRLIACTAFLWTAFVPCARAAELPGLLASGGPAADGKELAEFGRLVGSWDLDVAYHRDDGRIEHRPGEWHFAWILEGRAIYVVADLSTVWVDLNVYRQDADRVKEGQKVVIDGGEGLRREEGQISYISPFGAETTQTLLARVVLPNPHGQWRPGLFVNVQLATDEAAVPVTVSAEALQTLSDKPVVFVKVPGGFVPQPVEIGRTDGKRVEVLKGLAQGAVYAATGSFIVKSELGKATAEHVH